MQNNNAQSLVSIIIPSYNSISLIDKCLRSVFRTSYPNIEVILIDDCSTDGSLEYVKTAFGSDPRLKITKNFTNIGPAASRNVGIKMAKGEYLAFVETDMEVEPNWIDEALKVLNSDKTIGAVYCKVRDLNERSRIQAAGLQILPHTGWVINIGLWEEDRGQYDWIRDTMAGAVGLIVKKEVIDRVEGFDEKLFHNIDDIDFCWRIWVAGYRIVTAPLAITYHWTFKPSKVRGKIIKKEVSEFHFNKAPMMLLKNYELKNLIRYLPACMILHFVRALLNLIRMDFLSFKAYCEANIWLLTNLRSSLKERYKVQSTRRFADKYIFDKVAMKSLKKYIIYSKEIRKKVLST